MLPITVLFYSHTTPIPQSLELYVACFLFKDFLSFKSITNIFKSRKADTRYLEVPEDRDARLESMTLGCSHMCCSLALWLYLTCVSG